MKELLFINACVRGNEQSRTYKIAKEYLDELNKNKEYNIIEKVLMDEQPKYLSYDNFAAYEEETQNGLTDKTKFTLAREFATVDNIIIAAPFWELTFPAILSIYIENISIPGITFEYTQEGSKGLCKAEKLMYVYTAGGFLNEEDCIGEKLLLRLTKLYGIEKFDSLNAQGLDIFGIDTKPIISKAIDQAKEKASK